MAESAASCGNNLLLYNVIIFRNLLCEKAL